MNINFRNCNKYQHENFVATNLCLSRDCTISRKWCCIQCITQGIHNHNKKDLSHIIPWQQAVQQKKEEITQFQKLYQKHSQVYKSYLLSKGLQQCKQILKILQEYSSFIINQTKIIDNENQKFDIIISDLKEEIFIQLDDSRIGEIMNLNQNYYLNNTKLQSKTFQIIDETLNNFESLINNHIRKLKMTDIQTPIKDVKYKAKQIDQTSTQFNASSISNDENYIAYGGDDSIIKIYDIKNNKIKEKSVDSYIYSCLFSEDSSQLFVGTHRGYVHGYDVSRNFNIIFQTQIHLNIIFNIRIINNYLITYSNDKSIIKTDIKTKQQLFKLNHLNFITAIETSKDMIVTGCADKSIILWDQCSLNKIIHKQQSHPKQVRQFQFINNNQNLLSLDQNSNLYKWRIDLVNKVLEFLMEFKEQKNICSFSQIYDKNLILICENQIRILDEQGCNINCIDHGAKDFGKYIFNKQYFVIIDSHLNECRQLDSGRYFHVRSKCKAKIIYQNKSYQQKHFVESYL